MKIQVEVEVRFYAYEFSRDEFLKFVSIRDKFNKEYDESPHDPTPAVQMIFASVEDNESVYRCIVKSHLAEEWDDLFCAEMKEK